MLVSNIPVSISIPIKDSNDENQSPHAPASGTGEGGSPHAPASSTGEGEPKAEALQLRWTAVDMILSYTR